MSDEPNVTPQAEKAEAATAVVIRKVEPNALLISNRVEDEDSFKNYYTILSGGGADASALVVLHPSYEPRTLRRICLSNSMLGPCIEAMEVNIEGTGYDILPSDDDESLSDEQKAEIKSIAQMLDEPYPGLTFTQLRRKIRRDRETIGYGYMEVIRDNAGGIAFLRDIDAGLVRKCKLGPARPKNITIDREGKPVNVTVTVRDRTFVMSADNKDRVYFKEFGCELDLDKDTGKYAAKGSRLPAVKRATELLAFELYPDPDTSYSLPRWINQMPSVLGQRSAEELNLEYFEAGGIPPVLVFLQGGEVSKGSMTVLENIFSGSTKSKQRGAVVPVVSTGGTLDKEGSVDITVERFGSEKQTDSMFGQYDDKTASKVRMAFRLPKLFTGSTEDMNYATAFASYTVTESQVFKPERDAFDQQFNTTIMKALTEGKYVIKSRPLTVTDISNQLAGLGVAVGSKAISNEDLINELNSLLNMSLKWNGKENADVDKLLNDILNMTPEPDDKASTEVTDPTTTDSGDAIPAASPIAKSEFAIDTLFNKAAIFAKVIMGDPLTPLELVEIQSIKKVSKQDKNLIAKLGVTQALAILDGAVASNQKDALLAASEIINGN